MLAFAGSNSHRAGHCRPAPWSAARSIPAWPASWGPSAEVVALIDILFRASACGAASGAITRRESAGRCDGDLAGLSHLQASAPPGRLPASPSGRKVCRCTRGGPPSGRGIVTLLPRFGSPHQSRRFSSFGVE